MPETLPASARKTVHYQNDISSRCFSPCKDINLHFDGVATPSSCHLHPQTYLMSHVHHHHPDVQSRLTPCENHNPLRPSAACIHGLTAARFRCALPGGLCPLALRAFRIFTSIPFNVGSLLGS